MVEELRNPELTRPWEMEFPLQFLDLSPSIPLQFLDLVVSLKPDDFLDLPPSYKSVMLKSSSAPPKHE